MQLLSALLAVICAASVSASVPSSPKVHALHRLRGGEDLFDKDRVKFEQAVPLAVAVASVAIGLDVLIEPERTAKYLEGDYLMTDEQKKSAMASGAIAVLKGVVIGGLALRADNDSVRLANGVALTTTALEEVTHRYLVDKKGKRKLTARSRAVVSSIRSVITAATLWALWSLREARPDFGSTGSDSSIDLSAEPDSRTTPYQQ